MNRDELYKYWDLSIFLDINFKTVIKRALLRDTSLFGSKETVFKKYKKRYIPGEKIYLNSCFPKKRTDIVIDNNDFNQLKIIKEWGNYT